MEPRDRQGAESSSCGWGREFPTHRGFSFGAGRLLCIGCLAWGLQARAGQATYQVNMGVQIALGNFRPGTDSVFVSGNFSSPNWISASGASAYTLAPSAQNTNIYTGTFSITNGAGSTEQHKFVINPNKSFSGLNWESVTGGGTGRSWRAAEMSPCRSFISATSL